MTAWSIAIKTVGNTTTHNNNLRHRSKSEGADSSPCTSSQSCTQSATNNSTTTLQQSPITSNDTSTSNFIIKVNPDDPIYSINKQIELVTGLKANQQRLIYRGRIINCQKNNNTSAVDGTAAVQSNAQGSTSSTANSDQNDIEANLDDAVNDQFPTYTTTSPTSQSSNTLRVRDVNGLCDQQTIHLVPRPTVHNVPSNSSSANGTHVSSEVGTEVSLNSMLNTIPTHQNNTANNSDVETMLSNITTLQNQSINGGNSATTSLTGEAGMSLLAALLGVGANNNNGSTSANNANSGRGGGTVSNRQQQQQPNSVNGNTTGLGSVINQAVRMGVLDVEENVTGIGVGASNVRILRPGAINNNGGQIVGLPGLASTNPTTARTITTATVREQSETFPRLAPLGNTARRTMRNNRTSNTRNTHGNNSTSASAASAARVATARAARERRESLARLTEDDIRITNLGSVEPIRQGLLTLHTLLGNALLIDDDPNQQNQSQEVNTNNGSCLIPSSSLPPATSRASSSIRPPLDSYRRWYRGQWLDVLDTVNQWLEATIVDIVLPSDILSSGYRFNNNVGGRNRQRRTRRRRRTPDAVVSANDLEGRRRLLLEPIPPDTDDDEYESEYTGISHLIDEGYRPRSDNTNVQLLLVHYNGWPHRWDEWIRSDSERIRPFRTRTRHLQGTNGRNLNNNAPGSGSNPSSRVLHSPTPHATFTASPSTIIRSEEDDVSEQSGMIVELGRVLDSVNELYHAATSSNSVAARTSQSIGEGLMNSNTPSSSRNDLGETTSSASHLPWQTLSNRNTVEWQRVPPATSQRSYRDAIANLLGDNDEREDGSGEENPSASRLLQDPRDQFDAAQLRQLAPLIDRLGRTLTDAAPHVAALADSLSATSIVGASAALDAATEAATSTINEAINSSAVAVQEDEVVEDHIQLLTAQASHLYFGIGDNEEAADNAPMPASVDDMMATSLLPDSTSAAFNALSASIDRVVQEGEQAVAMAEQVLEENGHIIEESTVPIIDPNLTDYINGMVNTTRGSVPGERGRGIRDNGDPVGSSLLASYLSSMGGLGTDAVNNANGANGNDGARVIRMGGGNTGRGPGIDIHIHAVVTGAGGQGLGELAGLGGLSTGSSGGVATTTNNTAPFVNNPPFGSTTTHDSDHDLFSELYSESPNPVDPHGDEATDIAGIHNYNHGNDLGELFEECRSIEEEDSDEEEGESIVDSDGSSILALSEIDSQEATSPPRLSILQGSPQRSTTSSTIVADDRTPVSSPSARIALRSPSLRSRLFRNTFGRLPGSSRRSRSNR